ncbi:MAG: hypothetical protein IPK15_14570 [Verrucomicrobia bacterium]|nr:hypothetical protein [Verrucomicrobiota bacterium]
MLYLEYWLGDFANNLQQRTAGQEVVREIQKTILEQSRREYDQATQLLPEVQVQAGNMQVRIGELQEEIKIINEELQRRAQRNVEERHKGEPWQQAAGFLGRVCQVIPVYQPILAAVGQGLVLASEYDKNDPWKTLSQVPEVAKQFTSENWDKSVAQTKETLDTLPIPDLDDAELSDIPAIVEDFQTKMKPWKEHWEKMQEATRTPSAPKSEVEAELQKLRREHPELNEITAKVESLIADKEALLLLISQTTQRLGQLNAGIQFSLLAIDAMNQDISQGLFAFDDRAVSYLHEMGRRARERLLRYHYNLKKAYEYRLLRPYTTDLDLNAMFNRFKALAEAGKGARLDQADFQTLAVLYEDQLKQITSEVINWYNANVPERSASAFIRLTAEQLAQLNGTNSVLTLNFRDIGLFPPSEENHRIVNIEVREMRTSTNGNVGTGFLDLEIEHGGESVVTQGGRDYRFRHYNQDTQHPLVWGARYTPFANLLEPVVPSESAESLLRALLGPGASSDRILLWSRPGGQADFHMRRQVYVPPPANGDIRIEYLDLKITYDFYRRGAAVAVLEVVDESAISPLVELSRADQTGRQMAAEHLGACLHLEAAWRSSSRSGREFQACRPSGYRRQQSSVRCRRQYGGARCNSCAEYKGASSL